jgi:hypothetical protein
MTAMATGALRSLEEHDGACTSWQYGAGGDACKRDDHGDYHPVPSRHFKIKPVSSKQWTRAASRFDAFRSCHASQQQSYNRFNFETSRVLRSTDEDVIFCRLGLFTPAEYSIRRRSHYHWSSELQFRQSGSRRLAGLRRALPIGKRSPAVKSLGYDRHGRTHSLQTG